MAATGLLTPNHFKLVPPSSFLVEAAGDVQRTGQLQQPSLQVEQRLEKSTSSTKVESSSESLSRERIADGYAFTLRSRRDELAIATDKCSDLQDKTGPSPLHLNHPTASTSGSKNLHDEHASTSHRPQRTADDGCTPTAHHWESCLHLAAYSRKNGLPGLISKKEEVATISTMSRRPAPSNYSSSQKREGLSAVERPSEGKGNKWLRDRDGQNPRDTEAEALLKSLVEQSEKIDKTLEFYASMREKWSQSERLLPHNNSCDKMLSRTDKASVHRPLSNTAPTSVSAKKANGNSVHTLRLTSQREQVSWKETSSRSRGETVAPQNRPGNLTRGSNVAHKTLRSSVPTQDNSRSKKVMPQVNDLDNRPTDETSERVMFAKHAVQPNVMQRCAHLPQRETKPNSRKTADTGKSVSNTENIAVQHGRKGSNGEMRLDLAECILPNKKLAGTQHKVVALNDFDSSPVEETLGLPNCEFGKPIATGASPLHPLPLHSAEEEILSLCVARELKISGSNEADVTRNDTAIARVLQEAEEQFPGELELTNYLKSCEKPLDIRNDTTIALLLQEEEAESLARMG